METTPKVHRKSSLSLSRLKNKKNNASPQNRLRTAQAAAATNLYNNAQSNIPETPRSPSVLSICSDVGIECTPPHKKLNLDDSIDVDYSPKVFDTSFSPSGLLSQTLAIGSPEVGWRWGQQTAMPPKNVSTTTPDSAYGADSSFTSTGLSSSEAVAVRTRGNKQRQRLEVELRRAEKTRADDMLKRRCARLQDQLKDVAKQHEKTQITQSKSTGCHDSGRVATRSSTVVSSSAVGASFTATTSSSAVHAVASIEISNGDSNPTAIDITSKANNSISDFFNDSDSDFLLLEATQQLEVKIAERTQTSEPPEVAANSNSAPIPTLAATTPTSTPTSKEKRSSFYMKFLEDETPDEWFTSLDEVIRQAQTKKPRTSFQRYKSMPADAMTTTTAGSTANSTTTMTTMMASNGNADSKHSGIAAAAGSVTKMKRHASTHSLSPSSSTYRGRQLHKRK